MLNKFIQILLLLCCTINLGYEVEGKVITFASTRNRRNGLGTDLSEVGSVEDDKAKDEEDYKQGEEREIELQDNSQYYDESDDGETYILGSGIEIETQDEENELEKYQAYYVINGTSYELMKPLHRCFTFYAYITNQLCNPCGNPTMETICYQDVCYARDTAQEYLDNAECNTTY